MTTLGSAPARSKIWTDIDMEAEGKSQGYLHLPVATYDRSDDEAGYNWEGIPVISFRNGAGPRVLLMAGNHGNEYEGQVLLMKLLRSLQLNNVAGHLIILPAANGPAVKAHRRVSPIDGGNLNRLFPGDPVGDPTSMIAHFIESELLTRVDHVIDLHSGSLTMEYLPCAVAACSDDQDRFARSLEYLSVFGMPTSMIIDHSTGEDRALIGACRRAGISHLSTELGGGASLSRDALRAAEQGLFRLLAHIGVLRYVSVEPTPVKTQFVKRVPAKDYVYSKSSEIGIFEPFFALGEYVPAGSAAGIVHFPLAPWKDPIQVSAKAGGMVVCRRIPARTGLGDCVFTLARPFSGAVT